MLATLGYLDLAAVPGDGVLLSSDVEREITTLLRAKGPELSPKSNFRIAASLIDSAAAMIMTLQNRVAVLEAERDKLLDQETDWENLLNKWRDITTGLKHQIRDLEGKLTAANQKTMQAEIRAQNAEEEVSSSQRGSHDLCEKVLAAFGAGALLGHPPMDAQEVAGTC